LEGCIADQQQSQTQVACYPHVGVGAEADENHHGNLYHFRKIADLEDRESHIHLGDHENLEETQEEMDHHGSLFPSAEGALEENDQSRLNAGQEELKQATVQMSHHEGRIETVEIV
jgi:hypothetical protein